MHRFYKRFDMKVNIEPNVKVVFNLTYEELLKRTHGNYSHKIFLSNDKVIDKVFVEVFISEPQDIKVLDENIPTNISVRSVEYIDNKHVYIKFDPSKEEQQTLIDNHYSEIFNIEYDVDRNNSNLIYTLDGYFVHFYAPDDEPVWPKNIVFMIDVSGSMKGSKLRQVKTAMRKILSSLDPSKDTFTFGTFSENVTWQDSESLEEAEKFITSLRANGGTNINYAMLASLSKLETGLSSTANIVFFLTDGEPTSGVTNKRDIRKNIKDANKKDVLIFTLGFGEDCDHDFLKEIAADNHGFSRKIYIDSDSDQQIKDMFNEISDLLLKNVIITYVDSSIDVGNVTKHEFKSIFKGSEIAIAGPLKQGKEKRKTITVEIAGRNAGGTFWKRETMDILESDFDEFVIDDDVPTSPNLTKLHQLQDITKKTWAYLSLKKMFEDKAAHEDIIALAIEYGFVTSLTSMVVTKKHLQGSESTEGRNDDGNQEPLQENSPILGMGIQGLPGISSSNVQLMLPGRIEPPMHRHEPPMHLPIPRKNTLSLPDIHKKWISRIRPATFTRARVTTTPTTTTTETTTPATTTVATTTPTAVPHLPKPPAIIVKPAKCDLMLCLSEEQVCIKSSKVLILKDTRADVEIYGETQNGSSVTCMDHLYKITINQKRRKFEITPTLIKFNRKRIDAKNREFITIKFKKFLQLKIYFNRIEGKETISLKFVVQDHLKTAKGLYRRYMKRFDCKIQPTGEVTLSNMNRKFKKVTFTSPEPYLNFCYM